MNDYQLDEVNAPGNGACEGCAKAVVAARLTRAVRAIRYASGFVNMMEASGTISIVWPIGFDQAGSSSSASGSPTSMSAFAHDLEERLDDVVVVTLTDFGRTAAENGTAGTDHGWANCMLLLGGAVARANRAAGGERKVVADWPGLGPDQLHEGRDLLHTTDFRDVLAELVHVHLGNPNLRVVLPQHEFKPVGLVSA